MYSFAKVGEGTGGGSGGLTSRNRESLISPELSKTTERPPTSEKQSTAETITMRVRRRVLNPLLSRRFRVDIGFSFCALNYSLFSAEDTRALSAVTRWPKRSIRSVPKFAADDNSESE